MESKIHFLSLIVPTYRQESTIVKNLNDIKNILDHLRYDYEIIVVIDGLVDKSVEKIKRAGLTKIKTIAYKKNQGKAWALRLGVNIAKGDYVMFLDSGMEIDPNGISILLEYLEWYDADIIVGSKRHPESIVNYPLSRKILSNGYYVLVKFLFGIKVRDTQAGLKIFKKKVFKKILPYLIEKKFAGDLEILIASRNLGFKKIYEAPIKINYHLASITSTATLKSIIGIFFDTFAIFYRDKIKGYYSKSKSH